MKQYECEGQLSLFNQADMLKYERCTSCVNAKYKEMFGENHSLYICGKHKTAITDLTRPQWIIGCKGKDFQRRENE